MPNRELVIFPGNVLSKSCTWRKGNESASEELYESLRSCIEQQQKEIQALTCTNGNVVGIITSPESAEDQIAESRHELKITVKLFLYSLNSDDILAAIKHSLKSVSADYLDSLVVSFAGQSESTPLSLVTLQKIWTTLEGAVELNLIKMIGLCDVDAQLFIQLYEWAKVKPSIVQINLASCCVVPPELATFAKEHEVQLLTHSDPINVLPEDKAESLIKSLQNLLGEEGNNLNWNAKWVLRYQIHVKCRGVLASKGYVASFSTS
jgi:glutamate--cysteine ligase regulatory subunit